MKRTAIALAASAAAAAALVSAPPASAAPRTYTAAQVAQHNTAGDCWTIVKKKVYDVTAFVSRHPGGSSVIIALCGRDGTAMFTGEHAGDGDALRALRSYQIGRLAPTRTAPPAA